MHELQYDVDADTGVLTPARLCPSPNCDARPQGSAVDLLLLHGISLPPGDYGSGAIEALFCNRLDFAANPYFARIRGLEVSAHLLIERGGELTQFVPFTARAWHAGESRFRGRRRCNDFSIGIELEGTDTSPYSDVQYAVLGAVTRAIMLAYPSLSPRRIAAHSDVAPGRKTDPGPAFDWQRLYDLLTD
ncbi:MAG: 1,6-anhydro-N-acetylmuramyl-L-alanine amidase AmpD [Pseudomonadota bacterium]